MKKAFLIFLLFTAAVCMIFAQSSDTGVIKELTGDVQLKVAGSNDFVAAKIGDRIAKNTIISTGFKSTALVEIGCNVITVRALTRLSLAEIQSSADTDTLSVNLQTGRLRVDVNPPAGTKANTTVQGPSATASVRGTSFEFDTYTLTVNEGTVAFSGTQGPPAMVNAGATSYVGVDSMPVDPLRVTAAELLPSAPVGALDSGTQTVPIVAPPVSPPSSGGIDITIEYK
jgi:hypothetical protein